MIVPSFEPRGMSPAPGFAPTPRPIADSELAERRSAVAELGAALRDALHSSVLTEVDADELRKVAVDLRAVTSTLTAVTRTMDRIPLVDDWAGATRMFNPVFGEGNAIAPPVVFDVDPAGVVHGSCVLGPAHEGPPGHAHGGITALLLDQAVGCVVAAGGRAGLTASLTVRYREPVPLGVGLTLEGRIRRVDGPRKTWVSVRLLAADQPRLVLAEAEGLQIALLPERAEALFASPPSTGEH